MNKPLYNTLVLVCMVACAGLSVHAQDGSTEYKVKIRGAKDGAVKKAVKNLAMTYKLRKRPPATVGQLRRRIEKDIPVIEDILESRGYYDGTVAISIDTEREPLRVYIDVEQGEPFRYRSVELRFTGPPDPALEKIKPLVRRKRKVVAATVFEEQQRILRLMKRRGYPFPKLERRTVDVDHENAVVDLMLEFNPGRPAVFGDVQVEGLESLEPKYIRRQLPWEAGEEYDAKEVEDLEKKLLGSGVFGTVRVEPRQPAVDTNAIPIRIAVSERKKRTLRLGASYSDIGPGGKVQWLHRNFLGGGERLEMALSGTPVELVGEGTLTRIGFLDANQSLVLNVEGSQETPDAYDADKVRSTAMVLRDFIPEIQGGLGLGYKYSRVEQLSSIERYSHIIFPAQLVFDTRNDLLDPVRGVQVFGRTAFFKDTLGSESFLKSGIEGRHYYLFSEKYRLSSALRLTLGSIDAESVLSVPADERLYAGGGGSVRGYEYQAIGPVVDGTPVGGDALLECSAELRLKPGRRLGYVLFVDGGFVGTGSFNEEMRYGAGIGLRWFTGIGPLRADFAYPLNPDENQVERLQFYISLGQAF